MRDKLIEVNNLSRDYQVVKGFIRREKKTIHAVSNVSFHVEEGEIFGLLGPNGAGKTTIIKMLTTLLAPTGGTCKVLGYNVDGEEKKIRDKINFVFGGEQGLYRRLSGKDNLVYFSNLYKVPGEIQKKRIPELLDMVGLSDAISHKVETYSKGMTERLQIAKGLINDPKILFLDEPTIGLDPIGALELRKIVRKLSEEGKTILLTTHYMQEAEELCNRVTIINQGKVVVTDKIDELKKRIVPIYMLTITTRKPLDSQALTELNQMVSAKYRNQDKTEIEIQYEEQNSEQFMAFIFERVGNNNIIKVDVKEPTLEDVYIKLLEK